VTVPMKDGVVIFKLEGDNIEVKVRNKQDYLTGSFNKK
jgi:hypothetical protein